MRILSRTRASQERSAWYPYFSFFNLTKPSGKKSKPDNVRNSFVQSQHLALALASLLHAMFFVLMGTRSGYPTLFIAYVTAAFGRAILTGESYFACCKRTQRLTLHTQLHCTCDIPRLTDLYDLQLFSQKSVF